MGVARGLIGNYFTSLAKGLRLRPPYIFQGATAQNKALVHCFEEELQHKVLVPRHPELMGALGMALIARDEFQGETSFRGFDNFNHNFQTRTFYGDGCTNQCEITQVYEDDRLLGQIGNRCEKCIQS